MEKRINTVQLSISFPDDIYEDLRKLAVRKHMSMAGIVRSFVADGLTVESHDENKEGFRRMIHDEMTEVFKQEVERLIKISPIIHTTARRYSLRT